MTKFKLGDIFVGDFPQTQGFGENPASYSQFGLKGHNGVDFGTPNGTQLLSANDGWVSEIGSDPTGYGNYLKVVHDGYLTIYGHTQSIVVKLNDKVVCGQLLGNSDNTGNSTGPHLHFGVAPCDSKGIKTETSNGYAGYIDPNGTRCQWDIKNLTKPVGAQAQSNELTECLAQHTKLVSEASVKDTQIATLSQQVTTCNSSLSSITAEKNSLSVQLVEAKKQADIYKVGYEALPQLKAEKEELERQKAVWIESEKTYNRTIGQYKAKLDAVKSPIKKILLQILDEIRKR